MGYAKYIISIIPILLVSVLATKIFALQYTVKEVQGSVTIPYDKIGTSEVYVSTTGQYLPFYIRVDDVPAGNYTIEISKNDLENLICAPTFFKDVDSGDTLTLTCIAKPTTDTVLITIKRQYKNITDSSTLTVKIKNRVIWYKVFAGGIESGQVISNGVYTIETKPKQIIAFVTVRKGGMVVWTGIMFPGQQENVTDDLSIKFYGAIDNVSYLQVYSTSSTKFTILSQEKTKTIYLTPICKQVSNNTILIKNTKAIVYYTDGSVENISAIGKTYYLPKKDVAKVICGEVLEFKTTSTPKQEKKETPQFIIPPRTKYYVGDSVRITANKEFTIRCDNGLSFSGIKEFTYIFKEPTTCTVQLGDKIVMFSVVQKPKPQVSSQATSKTESSLYSKRTLLIAAGLLILLIIIYLYYKLDARETLSRIFGTKRKEEEKETTTEGLEVEHHIKNLAEESER